MLTKRGLFFVGLILASLPSSILAEEKAGQASTNATDQEKPRAIKMVDPAYPYRQSRAGLTGQVVIEFIIDTQGSVKDPVVVSSNNPAFERPALDALVQWKFSPGRIKGRPVNVRATQPINFLLEGIESSGGLWRISKGKNHDKLPPEMQWETAPVPIKTMFPVYPFAELQAGIRGQTQLSFLIGPQGRVVRTNIIQATTPEMGLAVMAMIDTWEFKPARKADGSPAFASVTIGHDFDPDGLGDAPVNDSARDILRLLQKHPEEIMAASQLDRKLKPVSRRPPLYPLALEAHGQPGDALVEFYIDKNGDAQLPRIISSSSPEFGYAAVQAVSAWRFEPPMKNGKTVVTRVRVPMDFKLKPPADAPRPKP